MGFVEILMVKRRKSIKVEVISEQSISVKATQLSVENLYEIASNG